MKTNPFFKFATNAYREFYKPISQKIGEKSQIFAAFVLFLSIVNIGAGFMFFFAPIQAVTENTWASALVAIVILVVIEITSIWTFQESIMSIAYEPKKIVGYFLALVAVAILVFNVISTAEGNKETIQAIAHKTKRLETLKTDTLNYTSTYYENKLQQSENKYETQTKETEAYYTPLILQAQQTIAKSESMKNPGDWRKHDNALKAKEMYEKQRENKKNALLLTYQNEQNEIKNTRDSVLHLLNSEIKRQIADSKQNTLKTGNFHYRVGFVLVFLIIVSRALFVYAQIDTAVLVKRKNGKLEIKEQVYDLDNTTEAVMMANYDKIIGQANKDISLNGHDNNTNTEKKYQPTPTN